MKVLFDHQIFLAQSHGGISRYFCNLIRSLKKIENVETVLPIQNHKNEYLKQAPEVFNNTISKQSLRNFFDKSYDPNLECTLKTIRSGQFDIFHATYYSDYYLHDLKNKPLVITVHDMIYELFPELFSLKDKVAFFKKDLCLKADRIIAVSEQTKTDLLKFVDVDPDKISVIYQACSLQKEQIEKVAIRQDLPKNYLLFVGTRVGYKNFYFMVLALADFVKKNNLKIVCFGSPFDKKEISFLSNLGLENFVSSTNGTDEDLINLYKNAVAFISPSYYEGFGVTILEAMACGCPVLAAHASATPEAAGNAAIYFNPKEPYSLTKAVESIISDQSLRESLIKAGYKQNEKFSWEKTAQQITQTYKELL